ncbi:Aste57867_19364 [Aphanomyces stellatus]|uniref:Aste57867_19364 protein n=1 Tax=Aphanomyces stellatus TaxID=120398 RepID=A0A485LD56_9STRA|nr:hypothetical protein As57867_019300 [Aphanomyces stellatus]VFT96078.1 Aste57867_19364 [Aphanomyces stellatus]
MVTPSSPSSDLTCTKKRKVGVPKFLRYLYQILDKEDSSIISWANGGSSIQILDTDRMAQYILPKYFKHSKYASFQRQLNYFGFRKWTKSQTNICTFSHPEFRQSRPDRLYLIKRKNSPESSRKKLPSIKSSNPNHGGGGQHHNNMMADKMPLNGSNMHFRPQHALLHMNALPEFMPQPPSQSSYHHMHHQSALSGASTHHRIYPSSNASEFDMKKEFKPSHLMGDIENLNIQSDGPSFQLMDMHSPMFTPTPLPMLPDIKDSDNHFDFDMNCAWLDNFNPADPVNNAFNQAEYA